MRVTQYLGNGRWHHLMYLDGKLLRKLSNSNTQEFKGVVMLCYGIVLFQVPHESGAVLG